MKQRFFIRLCAIIKLNIVPNHTLCETYSVATILKVVNSKEYTKLKKRMAIGFLSISRVAKYL